MSQHATPTMSSARLACLVALLAAPLAACSERIPEGDTAQSRADSQREQEAQTAPADGAQQRDIASNGTDYADGYSKPREAWTGGTNARDAKFDGSAERDARAQAELEKALSSNDDFSMIDVDVQDGIAHLEGEVESEPDRQAAVETAMAVEGVVKVRNEVQVSWKD